MLDLDKIIEQGFELKLNGKIATVKQLNIKQAKKIDKLQSEMNEKNAYDKRAEITLILINNNKEDIKFTEEDIEDMPVKLQVAIHNEVNKYMYDLANDPN
ncbi:MAG: hypothetical protein PUE01_04275 [Clostridiaceae bacterium]|nr:hypothetical protein [Clostridiaceae bacterium]